MKINSAGIYNNRGLVPNRANNTAPPKNPEAGSKQASSKPQQAQKIDFSKLVENMNRLSTAELNQINKLFGQVDLEALTKSGNGKVDDRPGQLVDIVV